MADIKLSLFSQAVTLIGEPALTSLDSTVPSVGAGLEHYERIVGEEIENGAWQFATGTDTPTLLTARSNDPLPYRWQMPSDLVTLQAVLYLNSPLEGDKYQIEGRVVRCIYGTDITFKYLIRPDESIWPQRFCTIIVRELQAVMLRRNEQHNIAADIEERTEIKRLVAKHTESTQRRNRPLGDGTVVARRRGLIGSPVNR